MIAIKEGDILPSVNKVITWIGGIRKNINLHKEAFIVELNDKTLKYIDVNTLEIIDLV